MGNEQSVPAPAPAAEDNAKIQDPAVVSSDPTRNSPNDDVTDSTNTSALAIETENVKFNDGLPTPPATFDNLPTEAVPEPSTAPIGIPQKNAETRDKRPAFLRRLTTTPSAVLTAQMHVENATATPTSPSPEKTLKSVAKDQLNSVHSTRSRSATNPSITDKEGCSPSPECGSEFKHVPPTATSPRDLDLDHKELGQSLSSFQSGDLVESARARWNAPRSGSVSPLSSDLVNSGAFEPQEQNRDESENQMVGGIPTPPRETAFDGSRPVAFSVDDWAWRMEFLPSDASDDDDDIDPEFFPLPDGDDDSFADDELSFLDPGRESALRGDSRNEDRDLDLALVRTASSAESTQKAPSLARKELEDDGEERNPQAPESTEEAEAETVNNEEEHVPEGTEEDFDNEPEASMGSPEVDKIPETAVDEDVEEHSHQEEQQNEGEKPVDPQDVSHEVDSQQEVSVVQSPPDSPTLDSIPQPTRTPVEFDNRRDSAMYPLSLEPAKDMEQLQTIKEPEPMDQRKRMSLVSIEDVAGEPSLAALDVAGPNEVSQKVELSKDEEPADPEIPHQEVESVSKEPKDDAIAVAAQPSNANTTQGEPKEELEPRMAETAPTAPAFEPSPQRDSIVEASQRPATAHPLRIAPDTASRPLTAPSNPRNGIEGTPDREKSKPWRKTWPIFGTRAARSKSVVSRPEIDPDEILPATPTKLSHAPSTEQKQSEGTEQPEGKSIDDSSKPGKPSGLVSKIPTPAEQSKAKEKKKRGSILGSIFRHSSTKDDKSKIKDAAKLEKSKEKDSKSSKKNSKIAKVYRRSSKRQDEGGEDGQKEPQTPSSRPMTAMAMFDTRIVDEPQTVEPNKIKKAKVTEGVLKDAAGEQRGDSPGKGKYALPSASLGIPTLLQSPAKRRQSQMSEAAWHHRKSAPPEGHVSSEAQLLRRASMGIFGGSDNADGKSAKGSHLPQARPAQPHNRRASVHVPQHLPLRANPILPSPDDSPYTRATTGIPQPSTSKIFSYPNRNPPYRGIARTNSSPLHGVSPASQPQAPPAQSPRAGPSRIPSPSLSQVPVGRRNVVPRPPGQHRGTEVRRSNTFAAPSQAGLGLTHDANRHTSESLEPREQHGITQVKGTGVAISAPHPVPGETIINSAKEEQSFVAELADTDVGRRGSEEITMHATSYPGMEWVPEDME